MTIKELIEKLKYLPQDLPVIMSKDSEGNGYYPISDLDCVWYIQYTPRFGDVYDSEGLEELKRDGMGENAKKVVCFWPDN